MSNKHKLSATTVHIDLPQDFLESVFGQSKNKKIPIEENDFYSPVYRELLNNIYDAVIITDILGSIRDYNQRALDFFLHDKKTLSKSNIGHLVSGLDSHLLKELAVNSRKKLRTVLDATCLRRDQSEFPAEITANEITLNNEYYLIFCVRNITHRVEAQDRLKDAYENLNNSNLQLIEREKELAHERDLLHILLSQVPEYIFFKDKNSKFSRINHALADYYGLDSPEDAIGKDCFDLMTPKAAQRCYEEDKLIFESGQTIINQEQLDTVNSQEIWLTTSKLPIRNSLGEITGLVGISRDTTEKKNALELLMQAKRKAEEANKLKNDFIANITHELRTPLNPIIGFTTIIKNGFAEYTEQPKLLEEHTNYILEAATHLQSIIEDLLTVATNTTMDEFKVTTFSANALIAEIVNSFHYQIQKNTLNLKLFLPNEFSILFHGDRGKLFHIMSNYLSNAIKFTPAKGQITIRLVQEEENLIFEVEDNGIGIKAEDHERIFERFTQAENALTKTYGGTGLGLAIVKELCEVIGCEPYVVSSAENGSRFGIKIPPVLFEIIHQETD